MVNPGIDQPIYYCKAENDLKQKQTNTWYIFSNYKITMISKKNYLVSLGMVENFGFVWSSSVGPDVSNYLFYYDALALTGSDYRAGGMSVRCVRSLE